MNQQPNFEIFKKCVYQYATKNPLNINFLGGEKIPTHKKYEVFKKQINDFLDTLDIRQVPYIVANNKDVNYPKWIKGGEYIIDYNKNGFLDLINLQ